MCILVYQAGTLLQVDWAKHPTALSKVIINNIIVQVYITRPVLRDISSACLKTLHSTNRIGVQLNYEMKCTLIQLFMSLSSLLSMDTNQYNVPGVVQPATERSKDVFDSFNLGPILAI